MEHVEKSIEYYQWMLQVSYPWNDVIIIFTGGLMRPVYALSGGIVLIE